MILPSAEAAGRRVARLVADLLRAKPEAVLALPAGATPRGVYAELARLHRDDGLSFARVQAFNLDEYLGLAPDHPAAFRRFLDDALYRHIDLPATQAHSPDATAADPDDAAGRYEAEIAAAGGIDLALLGIGVNGHIAFNEPGSSTASRTRVVSLSDQTRAVNGAGFARAITVGIATLLDARRCVLLAHGAGKAAAIARALEGAITEELPASALRRHPAATFVLDGAAASRLTASRR